MKHTYMKQLRRTGRYCCMIIAATIYSSCIAEGVEKEVGMTGDEALVKITLEMPQVTPKTYAVSEEDENRVETVDILAFKVDASKPSGWAYDYKAKGTTIIDTGGTNQSKKQFTVTLIKSSNQQTFVVLANSENEINALGEISKGADKNSLLASLVSSNTGKWNAGESMGTAFKPFPMWGEVQTVVNDATAQITGVKMLRSTARLDVVLGTDVITEANFKLDKVYVYNSKNKGRIVPDANNMNSGTAKAATVPSGSINNGTALEYIIPAASNKAFERSIYLYEAKAATQDKASQATAIVVGGTYASDAAPTYYRLDFLEADKKTYRDVLRNHKYRFNIIKVSGRGYKTPDEAFNAKPVNMEVEVKVWDDGAAGDIIFNENNYIVFNPGREFTFSSDEDIQIVNIRTDYPEGWKITKITGEDGVSPILWLTINKNFNQKYGVGEEEVPVEIGVTKNTTGKERVGYITVEVGRMEVLIKVIQGIIPKIKLDITNGNGDDITELIFAAPVNVTPASQSFTVSWKPVSSGVAITNSSNVFPGAPASGTIPGGTGSKTYTLTPPAITEEELSTNPFLEKASQISFTVSNGAQIETKTLRMVRQLVPELIVEQNTNYYRTDGSSYNFHVRSNSAWRIKSSTVTTLRGSGSFLSLKTTDNLRVGVEDGYNTGTGTKISFTTANNATGVAKLTVVFECTDPSRPFEDKILELMLSNEYYPPMHKGWAGSNIYYDGVKLTFDDVGAQHCLQGVYFKWGSLYGIAGMGQWTSETALYPPLTPSGCSTGKSLNITKIVDIPCVGSGNITTTSFADKTEEDRAYLYEITDATIGIGDICKWLTEKGRAPAGKRWRMPTSREFAVASCSGLFLTSYVGPEASAEGTNIVGKGTIIDNTYFPGTDCIDTNGIDNIINRFFYGFYWSSSPNTTTAYYLRIKTGEKEIRNERSREYAYPIRCVVD